MLSPFWLGPIHGKRLASIALRTAGAVVVTASLAAGASGLSRSLRTAWLWATPSIFKAADREQMALVREALGEGEVVLLYASSDQNDVWQARLWQRGLYPRNPVVVQLGGVSESLPALRERFAIRHAVVIGPPRFAPKLRGERDLGPLPGLPGRVSFGELP